VVGTRANAERCCASSAKTACTATQSQALTALPKVQRPVRVNPPSQRLSVPVGASTPATRLSGLG